MAILTALETGGSQSWARVLWAVVFGLGVCDGSRAIWWLCVVANVLFLISVSFLFSGLWLSIPLSLICLTLLLVPESRRYVFERDPEPSRVSGD